MKLSFSTNAFTRHSLNEALAMISASGYPAAEILADTPHLFPPRFTENDLARVLATLKKTGLAVANLNANTAAGYYGRSFWEPLFEPSLANPDETARRWRIDYTLQAIDFARLLGAPSVSITSGRPVPGCPPAEGLELLARSLAEILPQARARGILLGLEYEPGLLIENGAELARFLARMNDSFLGANLDLGHSYLLGEEPEEVFRLLREQIFHIHIEDIDRRKHFHLIPGLGTIPFEETLDLLARHYDGYVTVELYTYPRNPEEAARRARAYLERFPVWT